MPRRWIGVLVACGFCVSGMMVDAAKPGTVAPVPLIVQFDDSPGMRITSDGLGVYTDGEDGVTANIDQWGSVIVNFQTTRSPLRKVVYDYGGAIDASAAPPVDPDGTIAPPHSYLSTINPNGVKLQAMVVGTSQCLEGGFTFTLDDTKNTQYRNSYHRDWNTNIDVSLTSYLVATRASLTAWELEPKSDSCNSAYPGVMKLIETPTVGKFRLTDDGRYSMPVRLVLSAK